MESKLELILRDDIIYILGMFQAPNGDKIIISAPIDYSRALEVSELFNIEMPKV